MTAPDPSPAPSTAVVVLWAPWASPSRPAPTVLRELSRRWGPSIATLAIEDPDDDILDQLQVEVLPTWLVLQPLGDTSTSLTRRPEASAPEPAASSSPTSGSPSTAPVLHDLAAPAAADPASIITLAGDWVVRSRRSGALPKHVVAQLVDQQTPDRPHSPTEHS